MTKSDSNENGEIESAAVEVPTCMIWSENEVNERLAFQMDTSTQEATIISNIFVSIVSNIVIIKLFLCLIFTANLRPCY